MRILGMPAAMDIAVDLLARPEGDDHVVRLGIFGRFGLGMSSETDDGQCCQRIAENLFHKVGF